VCFNLDFDGVGCDDLYTELWKACAGPLVDVPKDGERVFYFPQGHMEQVCSFFLIFLHCSTFIVLKHLDRNLSLYLYCFLAYGFFMQLEASTNQELNQQIPRFNLPPKILCRVVNIQLLVILIPLLLFPISVFFEVFFIIFFYSLLFSLNF